MATIPASGEYGFVNIAKRLAPDGTVAAVAELLSAKNPIITDIPWVEGNLPTGHRITQRSALPSGSFRAYNQGVATEKDATVQVDEVTAMIEARSQIDCDLADLNGNTAKYRTSMAKAFLEGIGKTFATNVFYGSLATDPKAFNGLMPRFDSKGAANGGQIITCGSDADSVNASIYIVGWSPETVYGIYPKGSTAGLTHKDLGEGDAFDAQSNRFRAYMDLYQWKVGLAVADYRYVVRLSDIKTSALSGLALDEYLIQGMNKLWSMDGVDVRIYCNRTIKGALDKLANARANANLMISTLGGKPVTTFWGAPIQVCDALTNTENRAGA